jgi:chemotaxis protein CheX
MAVEDDVCEIATSIWEAYFSVPLERAGPEVHVNDPAVTGCVTIDGAWYGAVMLSCERALAGSLTAELFHSGEPATEEEVRDTVGELTNMLAGNIKALLPGPVRISLPAVAMGGDYDLTVVGTTESVVVRFSCGDGTLKVSLLSSGTDNDS